MMGEFWLSFIHAVIIQVLMENAHNTDLQSLLDMVALELRGQEENMETRTYEVVVYRFSKCWFSNFQFYKKLFLNPGMFE